MLTQTGATDNLVRIARTGGGLATVEVSDSRPTVRYSNPITAIDRVTLMDQIYMQMALAQAEQARANGEVPVGAIIVCDERIIAAAHNQREQLRDPTAHAEMIAITQAAEAVGGWRLSGCRLYVTLEPCPMCAGAILQARIPHVIYGADDPKAGAVRSLFRMLGDPRLNHQAQVTHGVLAEPCGQILSDFFRRQRALGKK